MKVAVIGAGSWGTALAMQLARAGNDVRLWDHRPERAARMESERVNARYLPDFPFPDNLHVLSDMAAALDQVGLVVEVIPSQSVRKVMTQAAPLIPAEAIICCASKGIESGSLMTMEEVLKEVFPASRHHQLNYLAGPSFAKEVAGDLPTTVVIAGRDEDNAQLVADAFHAGNFRVYHTEDIVGAELGGALKNIIAIATGVTIGTSLFLKTQFGAGYEISLNAASQEALPRLTALVNATLPGAKIASHSSTHATVELPRRRRTVQQIPGFFNALASVSDMGGQGF